MSGTVPFPVVDGRRRTALLAMLRQLVPTCLPNWRAGGAQGDVADAILTLAASLEAEVTQRLDQVPAKQFRNFLDWIGIRRAPGRAARLYLVLQAAPTAKELVFALARLRLQAQAASGPIVFETEQDLLIVPGSATDLVAIDGAGDKLYLPPSGVLAAAAPDGVPRVRALAGPAAAKATTVQVTPALGLAAGQSIGIGGAEYHIAATKDDLITLDPPLDAAAQAGGAVGAVVPVTTLIPFPPGQAGDTAARNWQQHVLYIGATDLLNIDSDASIVVHGGNLLSGATWTYWGLASGASNPDWLAFKAISGAGTLTLVKQVQSTLPQAALPGYPSMSDKPSRWLRAVLDAPSAPVLLPDGLGLSVSAQPSTVTPVSVDAFANSVPLITNTEFYPLGREPRLFDQFYISAPEAMTKHGANVALTFKAADESLGPLVPTAGAAFSVRNDGAFVQIAVTHQAITRIVADAPVVGEQARTIAMNPKWPPSVANYAWFGAWFGFRLVFAAVVSGDDKQVWLWRGATLAGDSYRPIVSSNGWVSLDAPSGTVGPVAAALTTGGSVVVLAAVDGALHTRTLAFAGVVPPTSTWQPGPSLIDASNQTRKIMQIAVARRPAADQPDRIVLVDDSGALWLLDNPTDMTPTKLDGIKANVAIAPAVLWDGTADPVIVTATDQSGHPTAITANATNPNPQSLTTHRVVVEDGYGSFGVLADPQSARPTVLFRPADAPGSLVIWPVGDSPLSEEPITAEADLRGPPVAVQSLPGTGTARTVLLVPGSNLAVYSREWVTPPDLFRLAAADLRDGVRLMLQPLIPGPHEGASFLESVTTDPVQRRLYHIDHSIALSSDYVYRPSTSFATRGSRVADRTRRRSAGVGPNWRLIVLNTSGANGGVRTGQLTDTTLTLEPGDSVTTNEVILIGDIPAHYETARTFTVTPAPGNTATLVPAPGLNGIPNGTVKYQHVRVSPTVAGTLLPTLTNVPSSKVQALLVRGLVSDGNPAQQAVLGQASDPFLVLQSPWITAPPVTGGQIEFHVAAQTPGAWAADQQPVAPNPELSWEYWNGRSWLHLDLLADETRNLLQSGDVRFAVPIDLTPTDVAGRTQPWIRARLIGGEYGKEVYKLSGTPGESQTAERDTSRIHPPRMLNLRVTYKLTEAQRPDFLLTYDSRTLRDQSAANQLSGAVVTAFQPVASMLAGFGPDDAAAASRALFIGLQSGAPPAAGVIRLLALVREQPGQIRLMAETLREGRFVELPLTDDTSGLTQDGLLSVALDAPLQLAALFGAERYWLRLRPRPDDPGLATWQPVLQGLYLNGASAEAAETQDLEVLGSSDGSPHQRVTLARPPILADSLDLRVREPLSDEDIAALRLGDPDRVRTDLATRPGAWVRWTEVPDVVDAGPGDRVYRLDPATGDVFFGDAQAGLVPPVGRDGIIARTYRRAGGAAANQVAAWTSLNLVTTLQGVEQAVAPRAAAGGADPATDAMTLVQAPAALRDRGRAITGDDLEAIALANAPEFAQARFIQSGRSSRLVVVANGPDPQPNKAQRDALRARLAAVMLPRLAAAGGLTINPPVLRPLAINAALTVESLDIGGTVEATARAALAQLLDPAIGGLDGSGWPLGSLPQEADLMAVLVEIDGLVGVTNLTVSDVGSTGKPPRQFAPDELVTLSPDHLVLSLNPVTP